MILRADDCIKMNDDFYMVCRDANIVYRINMKDKKVFLLDNIPEEIISTNRLCVKIVNWNDELIFIPFNTKKIWILNIVTQEWDKIEIKGVNTCKKQGLFFQAVTFEKHLFVIGSNYPAILDMDLETKKVTYIFEPYRKRISKDILFRCHYVQKDDNLYLASCISNEILIFNMRTYQYRWIPIGKKQNKYVGIGWDGNNFWIAPKYNTTLVKWDGNNEIIEYKLPESQNKKQEFIGIVIKKNSIIIPGGLFSQSVVIPDFNLNKAYISREKYYFYHMIDKDEYAYMNGKNEFHIEKENMDKSMVCKIKRTDLSSFFQTRKYAKMKFFDETMKENEIINSAFLCEHIDYLLKSDEERKQLFYGENIWKYLQIND